MAQTDASESETEVLTVEEAASILRISRNAAYALTRQWRVTGGQSGLPCFELGRCIRVPRSALREMLSGAPARQRRSTSSECVD
jgi:hypothetical protein